MMLDFEKYIPPLIKNLGEIITFFWSKKKLSTFFITFVFVLKILIYPTTLISAPETRPYDKQLLRLSELLGAIHYLRELCSANDGQRWREHMQSILDSETSNAARKARLTRSFNQGYRNHSHTYSTCTPSAQATIERFLAESADISEGLVIRAP